MNHSKHLLILMLLIGWLPAACTTAGSEPVASRPTATAVQATPDGLQAMNTPPASAEVVHDGLRLSYDPDLLGVARIEDLPATARQGMFEQPTPAHTRISFWPPDMQPAPADLWSLTRAPQVLLFHLDDFGSFAPADEQARQKIGAFRQILRERPSEFPDEIPVLPPINAAQMLRAQVRWLALDGGEGVRFVTAYSQEVIPVTNDRLIYVFLGMTDDGQHGITAVFPLTAAGLPDTIPVLSDADFVALNEHYSEAMAATTEQLNGLSSGAFAPSLTELDALVQSLHISPMRSDVVVTATGPQNAQLLSDSDVFDAPDGTNAIDTLAAGDAVVVNGRSADDRYSRILCSDGTTGSCWLPGDALEITAVGTPVAGSGSGPVDGQVVRVRALVENVVFAGPSDTAAPLGSLRVGEEAAVFAGEESGLWLNIDCPRYIGESCWVIADTTVNEPIGFFSSDGWKAIGGSYVSFRVPIEWDTQAATPGGGSVLEAWHLGVPGAASDQDAAFFAVAYDALHPPDVERDFPFEIGGQPGAKWVRSGQGYVSYDYYTAGVAGAGSFGIHVTVPEPDLELEATLDRLANSVVFSP